MKPTCFYLTLFFLIIIGNTNGYSTQNRLTILHTNDLHSHFLGFSPNSDYSPQVTGNDKTTGGWARISTVIHTEKSKRENPCLVLDAGDFLMGSLFHMLSREEAFELVMMKEMGYDVTTLGNHEFDLKPQGLAKIIAAASAKGKIPKIVSSNIIFDPLDKDDDHLKELFTQGVVQPYTVLKKGKLKIGFFGLVGKDAAGVAPFASPVKFADPVETAKQMVKVLKGQEEVDLVICLSHSGLEGEMNQSEDVMLAQSVSGIDIIISGHSHTDLGQPIIQNGTIIVQAGAYGKQIGVLDVIVNGDDVKLEKYKTIVIDDTIKGDDRIIQKIDSAKQLINQKILKPYQLLFDQVLVETDFDLRLETDESNLGNLIADATKWSVNNVEYNPDDPLSRVMISIQANGVIRDNILKGHTGQVSVSDLFRVVPLGIGWDGTLSYPLVSFYVTASEIKKACEILTTVYPMKNSDYFLQLSGLKLGYNNNRMFFDRVTKISIEDENGDFQPLDYSDTNTRLYKVVSNIYNATFLKVIGGFTYNILTIVPKDRSGRPIDDFTDARVDGDRNKEGIQEIKDWTALMGYVQSFQDKDGDGVPEIPEKYRGRLGRQTRDFSLNPYKLLAGGNHLTWIALGCIILAFTLITLIIMVPLRILKKRRLKAYGKTHLD